MVLFFTMFAQAGVFIKKISKTSQAIGIGRTRVDAVNNAISEALKQSNIKNNKDDKNFNFVDIKSINEIVFDTSQYIYNVTLNKVTLGKVDSYKIINFISYDDGRYEVSVEIKKIRNTKNYALFVNSSKNRSLMLLVPSSTNANIYFFIIDDDIYEPLENIFP